MQEVIQHLIELTRLVSALFAGYLVNGWPFFLAHVFVAILIRNSWLELNRERDALRDWKIRRNPDESRDVVSSDDLTTVDVPSSLPSAPDSQKRQTIVVLEQFVSESRVLGAKGFFVPMTDFSDRLDSAVEGKIAELHDRTNLFLFVGIAGTMFGVFEFAYKSYQTIISQDIQQNQKLVDLAKYLSGSMSKAFPVGFFGLLFTFIAQVISSRPEHRLRAELSEATRKALEARETATQSHVALILEAAESIQTAMEPLKDLRDTLSESLKPVVEVFGSRLDKSLGLLEAQFKRVEETSAGIQSAVSSVVEAVGSVAAASKNLERLITETPVVINRLLDLEKAHEHSLGKLEAYFDSFFERANELSKGLEAAIANLGSLSERVIRESTDGIKRVEVASVASWTDSSDMLRKKLEQDLAALFGDVGTQMAALKARVDDALITMKSLADASAVSLTAVQSIAPQISGSYAKSLEQVGAQTITSWNRITAELGSNSQKGYLEHLSRVESGTLSSTTALGNAASAWERIASNSEQLLRGPVETAVKEARRDLIESLRALDTNVEQRIKQASEDLHKLHTSAGELVTKVNSINESLVSWAKTAGPVSEKIKTASETLQPVTEELKRQSKSQEHILTQLTSTADQLKKLTSRPFARPNDHNPSVEPTAPPTIRVWWKPTTWFS